MAFNSTTEALRAAEAGDAEAIEEIFPIVYDELRSIAHKHLAHNALAHQLSSTELVHEAFLKLVDHANITVKGRTHFFALGSRVMRQLLVDRARRNVAARRGGGAIHLSFQDDLLSREENEHVLAVEAALKKLEQLDPRQAQIVEMRFYGGMTVAEVADFFDVNKRSIESEWTMIRAWLRQELSSEMEP